MIGVSRINFPIRIYSSLEEEILTVKLNEEHDKIQHTSDVQLAGWTFIKKFINEITFGRYIS